MSKINNNPERIAAILELIYSVGEGNFQARGQLSDNHDDLDAVMAGLNMLAQELEFAASARRKAEEQLADEVDAYESAPALFCTVEASSWRVVKSNAMFSETLGYGKSELLGRSILERHSVACQLEAEHALQRVARGEALSSTAFELVRRDGKLVDVELSASLVPDKQRLRLIWRDVTEQRALAQQLGQALKLQAIGQLAGGVAHDFNNLLTVIIGTGELALDAIAPEHPIAADLSEIIDAARSGAQLTHGLLAFSRKSVVQPTATTLNAVVDSAQKLLSRILDEHVTIDVRKASNPWTVLIDVTQFEQVVVNLAINARDAMPTGGTLTIETANVELTQEYVATHMTVEPGDYAMLAVSDTGVGMDAETRLRAFEPFFTSKGLGKGTGLGLASCYGHVRQAGGSIWLYSEPGKGTSVKIYLPRVDLPPQQRTLEPEYSEERSYGTVLLAEDDDQVRALAARVLRSVGYHVIEAENGADALAKAVAHGTPVDLVLTDVIMPHMGGLQLVEQLRSRALCGVVLFVSGYTENSIVHHGVLDEGIHFLSKPYSPKVLLSRIKTLLTPT